MFTLSSPETLYRFTKSLNKDGEQYINSRLEYRVWLSDYIKTHKCARVCVCARARMLSVVILIYLVI